MPSEEDMGFTGSYWQMADALQGMTDLPLTPEIIICPLPDIIKLPRPHVVMSLFNIC